MTLQRIHVHNVRSYELNNYAFDPRITLILGPNGSGKTTLLEAVYVLLRGTGFRGRDRDIIAHGKEMAEMKLQLDDTQRRVRLNITPEYRVHKEFMVENKTTPRLPAKARLPVVLFEPDELRSLSSSPQRRRDFIDTLLTRLDHSYGTILNRYARTLLQRNELLKQRETMPAITWESSLFVWDVKFAELSEQIVSRRQNFIETANERLSGLYSSMANADHEVSVAYSFHGSPEQYKNRLLKALQADRIADSYRGYTSAGPHRDDYLISLDNHPASETASRGEMRTIMLAYKLLEVALQEEITGKHPLILMDDVFSELDVTREAKLMSALEGYQTIITATDLRDELKIDATVLNL